MKIIRNVGKWFKSLLTNKKTKATTTSKYYPPAPVNENFRRFRIGRQKKASRYLNPTGGKGSFRKAPAIDKSFRSFKKTKTGKIVLTA